MDIITGPIAIAFGAIIAAIITAFFSYFNLVSSKESSVSEFRQKWIDSLRDEVSKYVSSMQSFKTFEDYVSANTEEKIKDVEVINKIAKFHDSAVKSYNSIQLRVNRNEIKNDAKILNDEFLHAITEAHLNFLAGERDDLDYLLEQIIEKASPLLKHEWNRVRDGEKPYVSSKIYSLTLLYSSITVLVVGGSILLIMPNP